MNQFAIAPSSEEAEQAVIGAMLLAPDQVDQITSYLLPEDFYFDRNREIFAVICEMHQSDKPIDPVILNDELSRRGKQESEYLAEILTTNITATNAKQYMQILRKKSLERLTVEAGQALIESKGTSEAREKAADILRRISESESSRGLEISRAGAWSEEEEKPVEYLIDGILPIEAKMLISGASKTAKTFFTMDMALSVACGAEWLGKRCSQGAVLYINAEVTEAEAKSRVMKIAKARGYKLTDDFGLVSTKGKNAPLPELKSAIIHAAKQMQARLIVVDPIYKVISGNENDSFEMTKFTNCMDEIVQQTGASLVYVHHYAKSGADRSVIDRASGSGVFARDADTIIAISNIAKEKFPYDDIPDKASPELIEFEMRSGFMDPIYGYFDYPVHDIIPPEELEQAKPGKAEKTRLEIRQYLDREFFDPTRDRVAVADVAKAIGAVERTIINHLKNLPEYTQRGKYITKN